MKKLILLFTIFFVVGVNNPNIEAQWWKKIKEKVQKVYKETNIEKKIKSINPKSWIINKINSNPEVSGLKYRIDNYVGLINQKIKSSTSPFKYNHQKLFGYNYKKNIRKKIPFLSTVNKKNIKLLNFKIKINDQKYSLYLVDDKIIAKAYKTDKIPTDNDLENISKSVEFKKYSRNINANYFNNLANISNLLSKVSYSGRQISQALLKGIVKIENTSYGNISASSVINPILRSSSGLSIGDIKSLTKSMENNFNRSYELTARVNKNSRAIYSSTTRLRKGTIVTLENVNKLEQNLNSLSTEVKEMSSSVKNIEDFFNSSGRGLKDLSSFSQIQYFSMIGNLVKKIENMFSRTRIRMEEYSNSLQNFTKNANNSSNKIAGESRQFILQEFNNYTKSDLEITNKLKQNFSLISNHIKNFPEFNEYSGYILKIRNNVQAIESSNKQDLSKSFSSYLKIQDLLKSYPINLGNNIFPRLKTELYNNQIIGSPDFNKYDKNLSNLFKNNKINYAALGSLNTSLDEIIGNISSSNLTFYIITSVVILGMIIVFIFIYKRKFVKKDQLTF